MRYPLIAAILLLVATSAQATDGQPLNALNAEEEAAGWVLLFDGHTTSKWRIEGDHEIRDGALVLGGKGVTRAFPRIKFGEDFEMRFEFREEGGQARWMIESFRRPFYMGAARDGWSGVPFAGGLQAEWCAVHLRAKYSTSGLDLKNEIHLVSDPKEFLGSGGGGSSQLGEAGWCLEVDPGNKLVLRNIRFKGREASFLDNGWLIGGAALLIALVAGFGVLLVWRKRRAHLCVPYIERAEPCQLPPAT
jgi:hypothetical protein